MEILIQSDNPQHLRAMRAELAQVIADQGLQDTLQASDVIEQPSGVDHRLGDPLTIFTVLVTAASAGGALTVALGKDGALTELARGLSQYLAGGEVRVVVKETPKTQAVELAGNARQVEKLLQAWLRQQD